MEKFERRKVKLKQLAGRLCAWRDCEQIFEGDMPKGWTWLVSYWGKHPALNFRAIPQGDCFRDAVLCPQHSIELELKLKPLARALAAAPPAGSA